MKAPQFSLRTKLSLSFLLVIVIGGFFTLIIGSRIIRTTLISQAQAKVRHDLSSAWMVFNAKLNDIKVIVSLTAARESLREAVQKNQKDTLLKYLGRVRTENGLDILTLADARGVVLLRTSSSRRDATWPIRPCWSSSPRRKPRPERRTVKQWG
jgi:two-component system NtrC family sensor kinase